MSPLTSPKGLEMLEYLPAYYDRSTVMRELLQVSGTELDDLRAATDSLLDNLFVRTTDEWGIERWEAELGLAPEPAFTLAERQDRVISRLRGYGTATLSVIRAVAEAYVYGEVQVDDLSTDPSLPDYTIRITFIDEVGIPSNLADAEAALLAVIPAHLAVEFAFNYLTWADMDTIAAGAPRTWDQWDTADAGGPYTWDEMEVLA